MKQLNQILIEGILTRNMPDVYQVTNNEMLSLPVYPVGDRLTKSLRDKIKDSAKKVRIVGSLKSIDSIYYISADAVEVKPE